MELAEPSIATAFARCVQRGARLVVVHPYFLLPGRHWNRDIPNLTAEAAQAFPEIPFYITEPLGRHRLMAEIMSERIGDCLQKVENG
jgi:sirohydrochlorin ferrochelatase